MKIRERGVEISVSQFCVNPRNCGGVRIPASPSLPSAQIQARQVVFHANDRCGQENDIRQLHACGALAAPLDDIVSNWAYMAIASLAWTPKCWSGLMIRPEGTEKQ